MYSKVAIAEDKDASHDLKSCCKIAIMRNKVAIILHEIKLQL